tara:strand:- start:2522 stop:3067 length:546 start_codon:yes stop_codon:yes gene_type:complete
MALVPAHVTFVDATVIDAGDFNDNFTTFKDFLEGGNMDTDNLATKWACYRVAHRFSDPTPLGGANVVLWSCTLLPLTVELDKLLACNLTCTANGAPGSLNLNIFQGAPGTFTGVAGSPAATTILSGVATAAGPALTATAPGFAVASVPAGQEVIFRIELVNFTGLFDATCELWCATKLKAL